MMIKIRVLRNAYRSLKNRLDFSFIILASLFLIIIFFIVLQSCDSDGVRSVAAETFKVQGTQLIDPCGQPIILKGVNKMSVFDHIDPEGSTYFPEIAKSNSNCVRIVWQTVYENGSPSKRSHLESLIKNCIKANMIPIIEIHDATCNWNNLDRVIDYWMQPEMVALVKKYEHALLVNIANEAGDYLVTPNQFIVKYKEAITKFRDKGIRLPLIIDAPDCGKNLAFIVQVADDLIDHDPLHNIIFSVHPYWSKTDGATAVYIKTQLDNAATNNIPLILGELCGYGGWPGIGEDETESCKPKGEVDYTALLTECSNHGFGWLMWEWGPGNGFYNQVPVVLCPSMDMTTDGLYQSIVLIQPGDANAWVKDVVISSSYGLQQTALKTDYILNGFNCQ